VSGRARRFRVPPAVATLVQGLHPDLKRKVRTALDRIARDAASGKALRSELEGLRSLKVGRFRIVYRAGDRVVDIVAVGPRESIYQETLRLLQRDEE
jgi:mRNA interferase RelE/StbE